VTERRFDLIVFDWDGTLFDSTALIVRCIQDACRDLGCTVPDERQAAYVIGLGLEDALESAVPTLPRERYAELGLRYRQHYFARQHALVLFDGALALLAALRARGHRLGVATGKGHRGLEEALASAELKGVFDATRTADVTRSKPHPMMLLELMAELRVAPGRTLMIGDTTHDLQMAANAGTASVAVGYGAHEAPAFETHRPLAVAHSMAELHAWLLDNG